MKEFTFNIVEHLGVIKTNSNGWAKEINIVSFCHREPKIDIREWSPDHTQMSKGMQFDDDEVEQVYKTLHDYMERNK